MTDVDTAEKRRVLALAGETVPERGKLSAALEARFLEIIADDGEYQGGVTAADFDGPLPGQEQLFPDGDGGQGEAPAAPRDDAGPPVELHPETPPRSAAPPRGDRARSFLRGRRSAGPGGRGGTSSSTRSRAGRAKRLRDRVPTGPLIERVWSELAWSASKIPPLQRVLAAQAPMAGVVLEDATRNTFIDRGPLQWLARGEERFESLNAMIGPPAWTTMIIRFGGFDVEPVMKDGQPVMTDEGPLMRPVIGPDGMPAWNDQTRVMIGGLRFSLMSWLRIGQRHAAEIIERAEELDQLGMQADALIRFILAPPVPGQSFSDMQREARQRVGIFLADEATGHAAQDDEGQDHEPTGSATAPAPATPATSTVSGIGWPVGMTPDPRQMTFLPPDAATISQAVRPAPMPQA